MSKDNHYREEEFTSIPVLDIPEFDHSDVPPGLFEKASKEEEWIMRRLLEMRHDMSFLKKSAVDSNANLRRINGSVRKLKEFENFARASIVPQLNELNGDIHDEQLFYDHYLQALNRYGKEQTKLWADRTSLLRNLMYITLSLAGIIGTILGIKIFTS